MTSITVVRFQPEWAPDFARLNRQWIERYFVLEEPDRRVLEDPQGEILDAGGQVFFALRLHDRLGFTSVPLPSDNGYVRADTRMELRLAR